MPPSFSSKSQLISFFKPHLNLKHHYPGSWELCLLRALLGKKADSITYVVCVRATVRGALVFCSGVHLITLVWGLVTGHHQPALCRCQEPFTPSSFSPNGTSESIKTIITANPAESKEIILGGQGKHGWGIWMYLSRELLDVHLARQPITVSIFPIRLVWIHWWSQQGFLYRCKGGCRLAMNPPMLRADPAFFTLSWWAQAVVWWGREIYVWLCRIGYRPYKQPCFCSHQSLMNRSQHPLNISSVRTSIVPSKRSIAGQCVFERLSASPQDS